MVIDTSALIAILFDEPERRSFEIAIEQGLVAIDIGRDAVRGRHGHGGPLQPGRNRPSGADDFQTIAPTVVAFDEHQAQIARNAFIRYGKGRHREGLNFGDCAAYALAIAEAEPLLFKGTGFAATDVEVVALG